MKYLDHIHLMVNWYCPTPNLFVILHISILFCSNHQRFLYRQGFDWTSLEFCILDCQSEINKIYVTIILRQTLNDVRMGAAILKWTPRHETTLSQWENAFLSFSAIRFSL